MVEAFRVADDVLRQGVQGICDLVTLPALINLDFADVRTIMSDAGPALLGIGMGTRRRPAAPSPPTRRSARRCWRPGSRAHARSCSRSPVAPTSRSGRSTRPRRSSRRPRTPRPTSSSAQWSTRTSTTRSGSRSSPRAYGDHRADGARGGAARPAASASALTSTRADRRVPRSGRAARSRHGRARVRARTSPAHSAHERQRSHRSRPPVDGRSRRWALRDGGNAVDAAVAAMLTSFIAETPLTGIGAGGFMLIHTRRGSRPARLLRRLAGDRRTRGAPSSRPSGRLRGPCSSSTAAPRPAASTGVPSGWRARSTASGRCR